MSIPAIAAPVGASISACAMAGITHANPLPVRINWKKRPAEAIAAKDLKRRIVTMFPIKILDDPAMFQHHAAVGPPLRRKNEPDRNSRQSGKLLNGARDFPGACRSWYVIAD